MEKKACSGGPWTLVFRAAIFLLCLSLAALTASAQDLASAAEVIRTGTTEQKRDALWFIRSLANAEASLVAAPALRDPSPIVRATAAGAAAFLPPETAFTQLTPLLSDPDQLVRKEAAYALGRPGNKGAIPLLERTAVSDRDLEVRSAAILALGSIGDARSVGLLLRILGSMPTEDSEFVRRCAARSIGQIARSVSGERPQNSTPKNFLPDKFKQTGARDITVIEPAFVSVVDSLMRIARDSREEADVRREAVFALGSIGDKRSIAIIEPLAASDDPYLAEIAKEALLRLRTPVTSGLDP